MEGAAARTPGGVEAAVERTGTGGPWFHDRPGPTVAVASVLYAAVLGLRYLVSEPAPITLLFCLPIALLAVAFGRRAGLLAGAAGIVFVATWAVIGGAELSFWGWVTQAVPMLVLGGLLGDATDKLRRSDDERIRLEAAAQRHRDAAEFHDRVVQELAAAKWALEAGQTGRGLEIVTMSLDAAQAMVSDMLREADAAAGGRTGRRLTVGS